LVTRAIAVTLAAVFGAATTLAPRATTSAAAAWSEGIPVRNATAVGMSAERLASVDRVVLSGIGAGGFPGAAVIVGRDGYAVVKRGYGHLTWSAESPAVTEQSVYDLASLTKVVATTSAIMVLYDDGLIDLDAPVSTYLPSFTGGGKERVTIRHLLTHRSGLPAGRDLWRSASSAEEARQQVLDTRLGCSPGACYEYSDLGADVLGFLVEAVSGQRLDRFVAGNVFEPLGMTDTGFRPPASQRERTAPTEIAPPRGYPLRGEVHDENAYALGGVAGHAGLFSTAADLSIFAQALLNGGVYRGERVFADSTVRLFTTRTAGTRALGWDTCAGQGGCGRLMGGTAFGHTGFTGTSMWLDPERRMFVVLLTNRVYEARAARPAKVIADVRADLADAAELAVTDDPAGVRAMPVAFRADEETGWHRAPVEHVSRRVSARSTSRRGSARAAARAASRSTKGKAAKRAAASRTSAKKSGAAKSRPAKSTSAQGTSSKRASPKTSPKTSKVASAKPRSGKGGKKRG
jgi:CubicO group peptidase (beta-lactamase class C family)